MFSLSFLSGSTSSNLFLNIFTSIFSPFQLELLLITNLLKTSDTVTADLPNLLPLNQYQ